MPVAFFKIGYIGKQKQIFAIMFDITFETHVGDITDFQFSVDFIGQITGEDIIDLFDDKVEAKLESVIVKFNE